MLQFQKGMEPNCPYSILLKSEGGKNLLIDVFDHFWGFILRERKIIRSTIIMVDLDGAGKNKFLNSLRGRFRYRCGRRQRLESKTLLSNRDTLLLENVICFDNSKEIGTFYILAFKEDLEKVANIPSDPSNKIVNKRISKLLKKNRRVINALNLLKKKTALAC